MYIHTIWMLVGLKTREKKVYVNFKIWSIYYE